MWLKIKYSIREKPLVWYCCILIVVKTAIAGGLPIHATYSPHDDLLGVEIAYNILTGNWLGAYDNRRLVKGITFPLFLVVNNLIGLPYTMTITLLYGLACMLFVKLIGKFINNNVVLAVIFTVQYFIPASTGIQTFSKVYRSSLAGILALLVFVSFAYLHFKRREKQVWIWTVISGISLALFWNLREDSMWIMPYIMAVAGITFVRVMLENRVEKSRKRYAYLICPIIPFLILILCNTGIRSLNYHFYGTFIRNELSEGEFPELLKTIYRIEPEEDIPYTSVPWSTVEKLFEISPSFDTLRSAFEENHYAGWDGIDSNKLDGEIEDGWFMWCLRDCIASSGYDTPEKSSAFCEQTAAEIERALETGQLPERKGISMPSALMSPWKDAYEKELPAKISDAFWYMAMHKGDICAIGYSSGSNENILLFETITNNNAFSTAEYQLQIAGWIVSMSDSDTITMLVYQNDTLMAELHTSGGEDVYDLFAAQGIYLENAHNSRFSASIDLSADTGIMIVIEKNGVAIDHIPITAELSNGTGFGGSDFQSILDHVSIEPVKPFINQLAAPRAEFFNRISSLYHASGEFVTAIGLVCYAAFTIYFLFEVIRKKNVPHLDEWLILSGLIGSVFVLCIGIGYTATSAYNAINPVYTSGGKVLLLAFNLLSISFFGKILLKKPGQENRAQVRKQEGLE